MASACVIKNTQELLNINDLLYNQYHDPLYSDIWELAINVGLTLEQARMVLMSDANRALAVDELMTKYGQQVLRMPLNKTAGALIKRRMKDYPRDVYLFQAHHRNANPTQPVSREMIQRMVRDLRKLLGIDFGVQTPRKSYAHTLFRNGWSVERICKLLGQPHYTRTLDYINEPRSPRLVEI